MPLNRTPSTVVARLPQEAPSDPVPATPNGAGEHPTRHQWRIWINGIDALIRQAEIDPSGALILVPYAQLMDAGRRAWAEVRPSGFSPRFESTRNWATSLQPFAPGPTDLSMDMARDSLVAAAFIERVSQGRLDASMRAVMVARLVEAARQLAPIAAAMPPDQRGAWAEPLRDALATGLQTLHWESLLGSLALVWASTSAYATDVLWSPLARSGSGVHTLIVLQGFQQDPLASALARHWGAQGAELALPVGETDPAMPSAVLHACGDAEDEAHRAAACVIARVNAGLRPVALVANDRLLTRRVSAMLHGVGMSVRDETGWKLSTTHAAAQLMSLLRAADARARMDDVLDLLKQSPAWPEAQVQALEQLARDAGVSLWRAALKSPRLTPMLPEGFPTLLEGLQPARPLVAWLESLALALAQCGLWDKLAADPAGQQLIQALRLGEGAAQELVRVTDALVATTADGTTPTRSGTRSGSKLSLSGFTAWVRDVLEGASFTPHGAGDPDVVILPMAQLLGRAFAATVVPGCDEVHLNPSPEPPGQWTAAQREALGLPTRDVLAQAAAQAWQATRALPQLDLLWRTQERGEALQASPWVQALPGFSSEISGTDPRVLRTLQPLVQARPQPAAGDVLPESLSASAYQDLRDCPYRFFALRQLRLVDAPELEAEPDQRDMGNWLHAVLRAFHEQRGDSRPGREADRAELNRLADATADSMGLNAGEGGAGFLPYQAVWPALREGYLDWLAGFEATPERAGPRFQKAEAALTAQAGPWKLYGKFDRVDVQDSPEGAIPFVIDYKTEGRPGTLERVKEPLEDTQLAFYAALLPDENLRAAYLSITDKRGDSAREAPTMLIEQIDVLMARDQLREGLAHDMARVAAGQPMPALGEGRVCDFCAARGLCRKDFWSAA